jgi:hypothetical protein
VYLRYTVVYLKGVPCTPASLHTVELLILQSMPAL